MPSILPSNEARQVLTAIAPGGFVEDDAQAFDAAVAHLLRTTNLDAAQVEQVAREVEGYCRERGWWGMVEGRRRRLLPMSW